MRRSYSKFNELLIHEFCVIKSATVEQQAAWHSPPLERGWGWAFSPPM